LAPKPKPRFVELREAGPLVVGGETACGTSVLIRGLIGRAFGVLDHCQSGWTWRPNWGVSCQTARLVSEQLDAARRQPGLQPEWPRRRRAAQRQKGLLLLEAAASVAQGGSWSSTWARRGPPPEGKPRGKRQGDKGFGAMASVAGRRW
jgi:hypothetical protein